MDASHWVVAFLFFTALHETEQRPIVEDTAPFSNDFPGGHFADEFLTDVPARNPDDTSITAPEAVVQPSGALRLVEKYDTPTLQLPGYANVTARRSVENASWPASATTNRYEIDKREHSSRYLFIRKVTCGIIVCALCVFLFFHLVRGMKYLLRYIQQNRSGLNRELQPRPLKFQDLLARDTQNLYYFGP
ncbi:uncharacterized protein LOC126249327 [Schistocerca nitens]|uniref:uncharacterized protein LOC126249327 n=1 Tax=Schistocerca nitens TaxID=7011 RepID=UPI002118E993|nr:uncharacterized protein LOC126249327 [Schistocerca nitens]